MIGADLWRRGASGLPQNGNVIQPKVYVARDRVSVEVRGGEFFNAGRFHPFRSLGKAPLSRGLPKYLSGQLLGRQARPAAIGDLLQGSNHIMARDVAELPVAGDGARLGKGVAAMTEPRGDNLPWRTARFVGAKAEFAARATEFVPDDPGLGGIRSFLHLSGFADSLVGAAGLPMVFAVGGVLVGNLGGILREGSG